MKMANEVSVAAMRSKADNKLCRIEIMYLFKTNISLLFEKTGIITCGT